MLPCVKVPDLARLIGRSHALRGITYHALPALDVVRRGRDIARAALHWS
jgi:hypothetical protein